MTKNNVILGLIVMLLLAGCYQQQNTNGYYCHVDSTIIGGVTMTNIEVFGVLPDGVELMQECTLPTMHPHMILPCGDTVCFIYRPKP